MGKVKSRKRKSGWASTKKIPHANHPAYFKKENAKSDKIKYVTFTHSSQVDLDGEVIETIKLSKNISNEVKEQGRDSYVLPIVYEGERSALGSNISGYKLSSEDNELINNMIDTGPIIKIDYVSNSKNKRKKKK